MNSNANNQLVYEVGLSGTQIANPNSVSPYVTGKYYYTDSTGEVLPGDWLGHEKDSSGYIEGLTLDQGDSNSQIETVVTIDSRIGLAVSPDTLLLSSA